MGVGGITQITASPWKEKCEQKSGLRTLSRPQTEGLHCCHSMRSNDRAKCAPKVKTKVWSFPLSTSFVKAPSRPWGKAGCQNGSTKLQRQFLNCHASRRRPRCGVESSRQIALATRTRSKKAQESGSWDLYHPHPSSILYCLLSLFYSFVR